MAYRSGVTSSCAVTASHSIDHSHPCSAVSNHTSNIPKSPVWGIVTVCPLPRWLARNADLPPPSPAAGMECYSCGGLVSGLVTDQPGASCAEFREALSWSLFVVTCPEDHICVKTTSTYSGEDDRE